MKKRFKLDWVLSNELAVGPAPLKKSHFEYLENKNIKSILNLCNDKEAPIDEIFKSNFNFKRFTLPDHKVNKEIKISEIKEIIKIIESLKLSGAVYIHCFAGVERSPLICMAWLISKHKLSPQRSLDYLMEVHKGSNPLPSQYKLLSQI